MANRVNCVRCGSDNTYKNGYNSTKAGKVSKHFCMCCNKCFQVGKTKKSPLTEKCIISSSSYRSLNFDSLPRIEPKRHYQCGKCNSPDTKMNGTTSDKGGNWQRVWCKSCKEDSKVKICK